MALSKDEVSGMEPVTSTSRAFGSLQVLHLVRSLAKTQCVPTRFGSKDHEKGSGLKSQEDMHEEGSTQGVLPDSDVGDVLRVFIVASQILGLIGGRGVRRVLSTDQFLDVITHLVPASPDVKATGRTSRLYRVGRSRLAVQLIDRRSKVGL